MSVQPLAHVVVVVPTAGIRPTGPLVRRLIDQAATVDVRTDVVVLDNGARTSAATRTATEAASATYRHVATPGIASARNAALDVATELGADALLFIDDDEEPMDGWLAAHLRIAERYAADVVLGPVPVAIPDEAPRWIGTGQVLRDVPDRADGPFDSFVNAGNTLLRLRIVDSTGIRFDTDLDHAGGEDIVFFAELRAAGAVVAWSRDAVAVEHQDPDRLTLGGVLRRHYAVGQRSVLVERRTVSARASRVVPRRGFRILRGAALGLAGLVTVRPERAVRGLADVAFGLGSLAALAGRTPTTYRV